MAGFSISCCQFWYNIVLLRLCNIHSAYEIELMKYKIDGMLPLVVK